MGDPLGTLLFVLGLGFLAANLSMALDYFRFWRRRHLALLVWPPAPPRFGALRVLITVGLAALVVYKLIVLRWPVGRVFGESMMLAYYGYMHPLSLNVRLGFFADGIALDRGFAPWKDITGLTWHHDLVPALIVVARHRQRAGRLMVPPEHYGAARRLLRDRIAAHQLHFDKPLLDLGGHDERDDV